jgi:mannosyltransferase
MADVAVREPAGPLDGPADRPEGHRSTPAAPGGVWRAVPVILGLAVLAGLVLRFAAGQALWLDEAQSVEIARLPLTGANSLWQGLREDGSPPLYYLLLHFWTEVFGTGSRTVRGMSALLNLASAVPLWFLARRVIGLRPARVAMLVFVTSPFALYFATETRMYSLLLLLALLGGLALEKTLRAPSVGSVVGLAFASVAVALTHYWSLYLLVTLGAMLLVGSLRGSFPSAKRNRRLALLGLVLGGVLFLPWLSNFLYQGKHTGTPWGEPASFAAVVHAFGQWSGGPTTVGRGLLLVSIALLTAAVFGSPAGKHQILIDLRGHEPARLLLVLSLGTLFVAVSVGLIVGNAWADRYTVTAFAPYLLAVALGTERIVDPKLLRATLVLLAVLGVISGAQQVRLQRTQAPDVASLLRAQAKPGDVLLVCPDQLGPGLARQKLPAGLATHVIPTYGPVGRVDWRDYEQRNKAADGGALAKRALAEAGPTGTVWLAFNGEYRTYENLCPAVREQLNSTRKVNQVLQAKDPMQSYERLELYQYAPKR